MIDLVLGLHLYQPANQYPAVLERITSESYLPVIDLILSKPGTLVTVDLARSAIENLGNQEQGKSFLEKLTAAVGLKRVSLANTAAYHPILPLLPKKEIQRQALLNEDCYFGLLKELYKKPDGFFPPEMAFSPRLIPVFEKLSYGWTVTDDTPFTQLHKTPPPFNWIPKQGNVAIFLRSNLWSKRVAFEPVNGKDFLQSLKHDLGCWFGKNSGYIVIWLDWETFGHHRPDSVKNFLAPLLDNMGHGCNLVSPSDLISKYPQREIVVPPGSWSTSQNDFYYKNYWPLWKNPRIEFHTLWWKLAEIVLEIKKSVENEAELSVFDKALYSCQTWQYAMGNKGLAKRGLEYFRAIAVLEAAKLYREEAEKLIKKLESLCE